MATPDKTLPTKADLVKASPAFAAHQALVDSAHTLPVLPTGDRDSLISALRQIVPEAIMPAAVVADMILGRSTRK